MKDISDIVCNARIPTVEEELRQAREHNATLSRQVQDIARALTDDEEKFRQQLVCAALNTLSQYHLPSAAAKRAMEYADAAFDEYQRMAKERKNAKA